MKKIFININDELDEKVVFDRFKQICIEEFQGFKLQVGEHIHVEEKIKIEGEKNEAQGTDARDTQHTF